MPREDRDTLPVLASGHVVLAVFLPDTAFVAKPHARANDDDDAPAADALRLHVSPRPAIAGQRGPDPEVDA